MIRIGVRVRKDGERGGSGRAVEEWRGMEDQGEAWRDKEVWLGQYE